VARAREAGVYTIGLFDDDAGRGHEYLARLGADLLLPASTAPSDVLGAVLQLAPRQRRAGPPAWPTAGPGTTGRRGSGLVTGWTKVSGGSGLTEAVVAAAEHLARRSRVLVVEAEEVAPLMVSRLLRSGENGLPWALSRARQGLRAFPEGLSGAREDGTAPVGHFDVTCAAPGAANPVSPSQLEKLVAEAAGTYDHVLVETGWLVGAPSARERFSAAGAALRNADAIVVFAAADPEGATRLVQWKAAALAAGVAAPSWAVFGRARRSRYEREHLRGLVEANTGRYPFAGIEFLPEDPTVSRARWNAEITWKGPWLTALRELVGNVVAAGAEGGAGAAGSAPSLARPRRRPLRIVAGAGRRAVARGAR
jgi:hypothetical protein